MTATAGIPMISSTPADPASYLPTPTVPTPPVNGLPPTPFHSVRPPVSAKHAGHTAACSSDLVVALGAKGFVILSGPSGTGKSRAAIHLARALSQFDPASGTRADATFALVPVGAGWTDARSLLGFRNPFGEQRSLGDGSVSHTTYELTDALRLLLRAADPERTGVPHFLILDEMNLSHVERYLSPILSLMEARRSAGPDLYLLNPDTVGLIHEVLGASEPGSLEHESAAKLASQGLGLPLSPNVLIVGTVNVDETTYMFSPKVLDRAQVVELRAANPASYINGTGSISMALLEPAVALAVLQWSIEQHDTGALDLAPKEVIGSFVRDFGLPQDEADEIIEAVGLLLGGAFDLLTPVGFAFGHRVVLEFMAFIASWLRTRHQEMGGAAGFHEGWEDALDSAFLQKVLPKVHGNRRQLGGSLEALAAFISGKDENDRPAAKYQLGDAGPFAISASGKLTLEVKNQMAKSVSKLELMNRSLLATGYVSFVQ